MLKTAGAIGLGSRLGLRLPAPAPAIDEWASGWYDGAGIERIGMPAGGIGAGMVYLSGDGRLWLWDVLNRGHEGVVDKSVVYKGSTLRARDGANYVEPPAPQDGVQGISVKVAGKERRLRKEDWASVAWLGEYPLGNVRYRDPECPIEVDLEAFSPFVPLHEDDSSWPATVLRVSLHNTTDAPLDVEVGAWLANLVGGDLGTRKSVFLPGEPAILLHGADPEPVPAVREDATTEDWNRNGYGPWTVEGTAFGKGPMRRAEVPAYQGDLGGEGDRVVNSHETRNGEDVEQGDAQTGRLLSAPFPVERDYLAFWIGGGDHPGETELRLLVDGAVVRTATGHNSNQMRKAAFDLRPFAGKTAKIEIVDRATGPWGHIKVGRIWQTDHPNRGRLDPKDPQAGTMALALLAEATPDGDRLTHRLTIPAKGKSEVVVLVGWHFPNVKLGLSDDAEGRWYGKRWKDAEAVVRDLAKRLPDLTRETRAWRDAWYDSTLPRWLLDRAFATISTFATGTCFRLGTGRFYAWEGIGCCEGTCTHVWHYGQALGRVFPGIERDLRERVDYGVAFDAATGVVGFRAEYDRGLAVDGQAGTILRTLRDHQTSPDDAYLRRVWPKAKRATEALLARDADGDGLLDGAQMNTLDAAWYGKSPWLSGMFHAALAASERMASVVGDEAFAAVCRERREKGQKALAEGLFEGDYFVQRPDPAHAGALGANSGCHIDQALGQAWAWQVGLPRVMRADQTKSALRALHKHNFFRDVGPYRAKHPEGRWYTLPGEGGLVMVTNPRGLDKPFGDASHWTYGYFNECMSGFEHAAAAHMIWEGLVDEGLSVFRAIHDRYHPAKRNPYNEVECSDHYGRATAAYGVFLAACGFHYDGPKGELAFAPRLSAGEFRAPFIAAEGWGTFAQAEMPLGLDASIQVRHGKLRLSTLGLVAPSAKRVEATIDGRPVPCRVMVAGDEARIAFDPPLVVESGHVLSLNLR